MAVKFLDPSSPPHWARVALAARVLRRVLPMYKLVGMSDMAGVAESVADRIAARAKTGGLARDNGDVGALSESISLQHNMMAGRVVVDWHGQILTALRLFVGMLYLGPDTFAASERALSSISELEGNLPRQVDASKIFSAFRADLEKAKKLKKKEDWTDLYPVDPSPEGPFGPLWLNGEPDWKSMAEPTPDANADLLNKLPSMDEVAALPWLARVAFAVRVARRVQPIFSLNWPVAPRQFMDAVHNAITLGENTALGRTELPTRKAGEAAREATAKASHAADAAADVASQAASDVAYAASFAAADADPGASWRHAGVELSEGSPHAASSRAVAAAEHFAGVKGRSIMIAAIARDFKLLRMAAEIGNWRVGTHVDPGPDGPMGPLWPNGEPDWRSLEKSPKELPTESDLSTLPEFARIALAARAARRGQPIFTLGWPQAPQVQINAVDRAIELAERSARTGRKHLEARLRIVTGATSAYFAVSAAALDPDAQAAALNAAAAAYSAAAVTTAWSPAQVREKLETIGGQTLVGLLIQEVGRERYDRFFAGQTLLRIGDGRLDITVPSDEAADLLDRRFGSTLRRIARGELSAAAGEVEIRYKVDRSAFHSRDELGFGAGPPASPSSSFSAASAAMHIGGPLARSDMSFAIRSDFRELQALAKSENWNDDSPVDPDWLGPLWPNGQPGWLPADPRSFEGPLPVLQMDIALPAGLTKAQTKRALTRLSDLYAAMSAEHARLTGRGLRFLDDESCQIDPIPAFIPAPSPSTTRDHDRDLVGAREGGACS